MSAAFVAAHTQLTRVPLVPEILLHLATEITPLWQACEAFLQQADIAPPFWAFAWPGSQALARYVLDNPGVVRGSRVLDFAAGCGLAGIACALAGAAQVDAMDIDPMATAAAKLNAAVNGATLVAASCDAVGSRCTWDVILCGDVCYEAPMTTHILPWLRQMAAHAVVLVGDPGRAYLPPNLTKVAQFTVPTLLELEDQPARTTAIYQL